MWPGRPQLPRRSRSSRAPRNPGAGFMSPPCCQAALPCAENAGSANATSPAAALSEGRRKDFREQAIEVFRCLLLAELAAEIVDLIMGAVAATIRRCDLAPRQRSVATARLPARAL